MRNIFKTPTQALIADIACWTALVGLLVCVGVTANNQLLAGVMLTLAALLGLFALVYNGRNVRVVVRGKLAALRWKRKETARLQVEANQYAEREARRERDDAAYGREVRKLNDRLAVLNQQYGR